MKKGILFDLDGTLWDTVPQLFEVFCRLQAEHPHSGPAMTLETLRSLMGKTPEQLAEAAFPRLPRQEGQALMAEFFRREEDYLRVCHGTPFPHMAEVLEALSGSYTLAVVSNCQRGYIDIFLDTLGVRPYITDQECAQNTGLPKGENIRLVMERNGLERAIYLGDTQGDLEAADRAGIPFIHAAYGFGKPERETMAITDLAQLPALAAELLGE